MRQHSGWIRGWREWGEALCQARRPVEAEAALRQALSLSPQNADTLNSLGVVLLAQNRLDEAREILLHAIQVQPALATAWNNLGAILKMQCRLEEALFAFRQAAGLAPRHPEIRLNLSLAGLLSGDLSPAVWKQHESRWAVMNFNPARAPHLPIWRGAESLSGKSILLYAEQGLGDTLQFVRYVPLLAAKGAIVHLEVQPALRTLLAATPGVATVIARGEPLPAFDLQCPLLSLPLALQTNLQTIPDQTPYVRASGERIGHWAGLLPGGHQPKVGLVWRGNPRHKNDANRSVPWALFRQLLAVDSCRFISLQIELSAEEAGTLAERENVRSFAGQIGDFADTAAIVSQLDLIVTVDTSLAHLAGALAKPVWLLLPFAPDWRWLLDRTDSPWYPGMRLFRQPSAGDWDAVLQAVRAGLLQLVASVPSGEPEQAARKHASSLSRTPPVGQGCGDHATSPQALGAGADVTARIRFPACP